MPITLMDVADDAVKIGLGVIIGGVTAALAAKKAFSRELEKGRIHRRQTALEEIAQQFETAHGNFVDLYVHAKLWAQLYHTKNHDLGALQQKQTKMTETILSCDKDGTALHALEGRLLVFGLGDAAEKLKNYRLHWNDMLKLIDDRETVEQIETSYSKKIYPARKDFYTVLAECLNK